MGTYARYRAARALQYAGCGLAQGHVCSDSGPTVPRILQGLPVEFVHAGQCRHHAAVGGLIRALQQIEQTRWHDLPAQAKAVLHPAAAQALAALSQSVPLMVDFGLIVAWNHKRHGGRKAVVRATIERHEFLFP